MKVKQRVKAIISKPKYFLVVGAGRGGTSLLASMLDCHPKIAVGFERFAFDFLLGEKLPEVSRNFLLERLRAFDLACKAEVQNSGKVWGNKITTEQIHKLTECDSDEGKVLASFVKEVVKNQKVIFIVRDGRHCIQSKMKRTAQDYQTALSRWKYSVEVLNYFKTIGVNILLVKYEDLLLSPKQELEKVSNFLECEFDQKMLHGPENPKMPNMYSGSTLRQAPAMSEEQEKWTHDMEDELKQLGYLL